MTVLVSSTQFIRINPSYLRAKRVLDIVFILLILLPLCIIMTIVPILIRLDSKGPIFFRQKRVGINGIEFYMLKFRSMYVDSDESAHREALRQYINGAALNGMENSDNLYKLVDDPRVTRVGRFLRNTGLDALPQFMNVLRGEMSLVGPCPSLPYEVELYDSHDLLRLSGKPGLTGTWKVYGRSRVSFYNMVEEDIKYLQQQSLWTDIKLILLTIPVMLLGRNGV